MLLDAVSIDGFRALPVPAIATFLAPIGLFYTGLFLIAGNDIRYGAWTALGLSAGMDHRPTRLARKASRELPQVNGPS